MSLITLFVTILTLGSSLALHAPHKSTAEEFRTEGILVDIRTYFDAVNTEAIDPGTTSEDGVSHFALVTEDDMYSFLESPTNKKFLENVKAGDAVRVTGQLLHRGNLVHLEDLQKVELDTSIKVNKFKAAKGRTVTITGHNKCQCGLDVGPLPASCKLGHLHHLEADDGQIYHYLKQENTTDLFHGDGSHFKEVKVEGTIFPGNFIAVENKEVF